MTRAEWTHLLPIVRSFVEGKTIEVELLPGVWRQHHDHESLSFSMPPHCYRVASGRDGNASAEVSSGNTPAVAEAVADSPVDHHDAVNHPRHYTSDPSGYECIEFCRWMTFELGNAFKYLWRSDLKNGVEDLEKAVWYLRDLLAHKGSRQFPLDIEKVIAHRTFLIGSAIREIYRFSQGLSSRERLSEVVEILFNEIERRKKDAQ